MAHPAVILTEGDVENPVQGVLDAPVPADGSGQDGRIIVAAGEEVADLGLGLAGAVDAADRLDRQQSAQIGPFVQRLKLCDGRATKTRRRAKRPWLSSKASHAGRPPEPRLNTLMVWTPPDGIDVPRWWC